MIVPAEAAGAALDELDRRIAGRRGRGRRTSRASRPCSATASGCCPRVTAPEFTASLAASTELQGGDPLAAVTWLQRAAHVRDGASRLETALLYAEAAGSPQPLRLHVAQLPRRAGDRWAGLPATAQQPITSGRLSLVVQSRRDAAAGASSPGSWSTSGPRSSRTGRS